MFFWGTGLPTVASYSLLLICKSLMRGIFARSSEISRRKRSNETARRIKNIPISYFLFLHFDLDRNIWHTWERCAATVYNHLAQCITFFLSPRGCTPVENQTDYFFSGHIGQKVFWQEGHTCHRISIIATTQQSQKSPNWILFCHNQNWGKRIMARADMNRIP